MEISILSNFMFIFGKKFSHFQNMIDQNGNLLQAFNFIKKETLTQVFSFEFCEVSNNAFSYRTPPLSASDISTFLIKDFEKFLSMENDKECV